MSQPPVLPAPLSARSVSERLAGVAQVQPNRTALVDVEGRWSYRELAEQVAAVARAVHARGLARGAPVALLTGQHRRGAAALIGIGGAGHPVVMLDPQLPPERMQLIVELAGVAALVVAPELEELAAALNNGVERLAGATVISLDALGDGQASTRLPALERQQTDACLITFTSGSTGTPKGVISNHLMFLGEARNAEVDPYTGQRDDTVLISLPISFGGGYGWLLTAVCVGATAVLCDPRATGLDTLRDLATAEKVTLIPATPSLLRSLLGEGETQALTSHVRVLTSLGEAVSSEDLQAWRAVLPADCVLTNEVGASETGKLLRLALTPLDPIPEGIVPAGVPAYGKQVEIVDPDDPQGPPLPAGQPGLVRVTSQLISPGYFRAPATDHARFTHPDPDDPTIIRLIMGDRGRREADGTLRLLGRADDAVKVRGYFVEPAEVVAALRSLPGISDAAVRPSVRESGQSELVAWVVADDPTTTTPSVIRRELARTLPGWMVPARIRPVDVLPRTERGKVDLTALAASEVTTLPEPVPPTTTTESTVEAIWRGRLGLEELGCTEDFAEVGGDSLTAMALVDQLSTHYRIELTVGDLLTHPTVETLSRLIDDRRSGGKTRGAQQTMVPLLPVSGTAVGTVVCVAGAGGSAFGFLPLAQGLARAAAEWTGRDPQGVRVVAFQARGLEQRAFPDWTIGRAASRHAGELTAALSPEGAGVIDLVGHSVGGVIATELARLLVDRSYQVGRVWLLDTVLPGASTLTEDTEAASPPPLARRWQLHFQVATAGLIRYRGATQRDVFWEHGRRLAVRSRPRPYEGPAILLHVAGNRPISAAWQQLYPGDFHTEELQGDHNSILTAAHVHQLVDRIAGSIFTTAPPPSPSTLLPTAQLEGRS